MFILNQRYSEDTKITLKMIARIKARVNLQRPVYLELRLSTLYFLNTILPDIMTVIVLTYVCYTIFVGLYYKTFFDLKFKKKGKSNT